jgi:hypothetical protein
MTDPAPPDDAAAAAQTPTLREAFGEAARRAGVAKVAPGEAPSGSALLAAIGGVRGIVESLLPGLVFLVTYAITKELVASVIAPAIVAIGFIVARVVSRTPVTSAIAGAIGIAFSAAVALFTGNVNDAFVPGLITNVVFLVALLVSILVRWPLLGLVASALTGDITGWRASPSKRRVAVVATIVWAGLFTARILVQVPLYLASATEPLAAAKLVMGVPLYAAVLWITWLLMRTAYRREESDEVPTGGPGRPEQE